MIYGADYPSFNRIFYLNVSSEQQEFMRRFQFLLENPPVFMSEYARNCIFIDFCFSVLNFDYNDRQWQVLENLVLECGTVFVWNNVCLVCDRPSKILLDENNQFHGEGESAIEFADGNKIYAYNGTYLPEKYSQIEPSQWQSQWVLEEKNKQLQLILIKGIGAIRICEELPFEQVDVMGEYTLLKFEGIGRIRTNILKRINAQTGEIKAEFVPWNNRTITEAIEYANQYISAEDFPLVEN